MKNSRKFVSLASVAILLAGGVLLSGSAANAVSVSNITVGASPIGVALSPDGVTAYASNSDGTVSKIDTKTNAVVKTITVGSAAPLGQGPYGIAVSPDGKLVYVTVNGENSVAVIDTATDVVSHPQGYTGLFSGPYAVVFSPDSSTAYVTQADAGNVAVLHTATNIVDFSTILVGNIPWGIALNPSGDRAYVTNTGDGTVSIIDTENKSVLYSVRTGTHEKYEQGQGALGVAVSPNGAFVYVTNNQDNTVSVIDTVTHTVTFTYPTAFNATSSFAGPYAVAFSPDSATAYVTNNDGANVFAIDTTTHALKDTIEVGTNPYGIAVSGGSGSMGYVANTGSDSVSVLTLIAPVLAVTGTDTSVLALAGGLSLLLILGGFAAVRMRATARR